MILPSTWQYKKDKIKLDCTQQKMIAANDPETHLRKAFLNPAHNASPSFRTLVPDIIHVPFFKPVELADRLTVSGLQVVTPISNDPLHVFSYKHK